MDNARFTINNPIESRSYTIPHQIRGAGYGVAAPMTVRLGLRVWNDGGTLKKTHYDVNLSHR
jgi:hypothetical protein